MANVTTASNTLQEMGTYLIKSMDAAKRQILNIVPSSDAHSATITYKDQTTAPVRFAVTLSASDFCSGFVVAANTRENLQVLIDHWDQAVAFPKLVFIFVNTAKGNKWLLRPHIHEKIAERKTLAQGLVSLFEQSLID